MSSTTAGTGPRAAVEVDVDLEMSRLRSFQRDTAQHVFDRMFGDGEHGARRFLVADEVGLGKTMVARGVVAQTIRHLQGQGDPRIDIVYICSNGAIAAQNLRKLAPTGIDVAHHSQRLPLLAFTLSQRQERPVNLVALTPGTSFDGRSTGRVDERAALMHALRQLWGGHRLRGRGVARIFAGAIGPGWHDSVEDRIRAMSRGCGNLAPDALEHFGHQVAATDARRAAAGRPPLEEALNELAMVYRRERALPAWAGEQRRIFISEVREALAMTGAHLLRPDMIVLDEFQRFRHILHPGEHGRSYAAEIAQRLFDHHHTEADRRTRVLLLSATPYVMHTTRAEEAGTGDQHHADLLATYRFLARGLPGAEPEQEAADLGRDLARLRVALLDIEQNGPAEALAATRRISDRLRRVVVRTERLAATPDRDGMLHEIDEELPVPCEDALRQYLATAQVARYVARITGKAEHDVVEYWKSAPYTLSYLGAHTYKLAKGIKALAGPDVEGPDDTLVGTLRESPAVLPWDRMRNYAPVPPTHAGLERLWHELFDEAEAHHLLWLPAALPYYRAGGRFERPEARRLTKRLVFSAWALVPTAIATLTSYECERRLHQESGTGHDPVPGDPDRSHPYTDPRRTTQRLRFAGDSLTMAHLPLVLPSAALARLGDPLEIARDAVYRAARGGGRDFAPGLVGPSDAAPPAWEDVHHLVRERVQTALAPVITGRPTTHVTGLGWNALASALLEEDTTTPLRRRLPSCDEYSRSSLARHVDELERMRALALDPDGQAELPGVPDDLAGVLALLSLAGPPSVAYRALSRHFPDTSEDERLTAAAEIAEGFRTLFNTTEAQQVVDAADLPGDHYWEKVVHYCAAGNLQAVLDEFCAVLVENRGYDREHNRSAALRSLAEDIRSTMGLFAVYRPAAVTDDDGDARWRQLRVRGRFALRYGNDTIEESAEQRAAEVGRAFNSPFWPYVLATTSVGQEGLDFHLYSHAVSHWNLPSNPVDLEQREGRVHRYKGHAVRKNVARTEPFPRTAECPWDELFESACRHRREEDTELIPYWVFAPASLDGGCARIERRLPLTPFTRERSVIGPLRSSVAHYRLAFGQPRQEELLEALTRRGDLELGASLRDIHVDLSPPRRHA